MPRVKQSDKYQTEREEICNKLLSIVGNEFYLCDIDADEEKQQAILALKEEIPKYFAVGKMSSFKKTFDPKRDYLNMLKCVLKQQGFIVESKRANKKLNDHGLIQQTAIYKIFRNNLEFVKSPEINYLGSI